MHFKHRDALAPIFPPKMAHTDLTHVDLLTRIRDARRKLHDAELVLGLVEWGVEAPPDGYTPEEWVKETGVTKVLEEMGV